MRLEQNYRSTGRILAAANALIRNNQDRKGKELWTRAGEGARIEVVECDTDRGEARYVVGALRRLIESDGYSPSDIAVLYRTNAQSRPFEEELQRAGTAYVIVGGIRFYERKEVKDLLAYLRLLVNPADDVSLLRVINEPRRGIGASSLGRLQSYARERRINLFSALDRLDQVPGLGARARKSMEGFRDLIRDLIREKEALPLPELGLELFERSGYRRMLLDEGTPESEGRLQNIEQLLADMTEFAETGEDSTLEQFLEAKSLMSPGDELPDSGEAVTLMTLHSAKGLEFPLVFVCGLEENLFPTSRAVEESRSRPQAIEEERRLCYVGITRARERLFLTYACQRYTFGTLLPASPSRFLGEIPEHLIDFRQEGYDLRSPETGRRRKKRAWKKGKARKAPSSTKIFFEEDEAYSPRRDEAFAGFADQDDFPAVGQWVRHPRWGRGRVTAREGYGEKLKLTIRFSGNLTKKVMAAYARLEPA